MHWSFMLDLLTCSVVAVISDSINVALGEVMLLLFRMSSPEALSKIP
jgi:sorbitol-specific phosphotransferase system component IIA